MPLALQMSLMSGGGITDPQLRSQPGIFWLTGLKHVPQNLQQRPRDALAIAVAMGGPGSNTGLRGLLTQNFPLMLLCGFWALIQIITSSGRGDDSPAIVPAFQWAGIMAAFFAAWPALRVSTLHMLPKQGLHELALLPGLTAANATSTFTLVDWLIRKQLIAMVVSVFWMSLFGWIFHAPAAYYLVLPLIVATGAALALGLALLSMLGKLGGGVVSIALASLGVAALVSMFPSFIQQAPTWLPPAWMSALLVLIIACSVLYLMLKRRPHPWLMN
jgi:hypothetical protein